MVNLIKVKRTSIAVVVALIMLFYVKRINMQVIKAEYVRTHTQRYYQHCCICWEDALESASNHEEEVALRKLIQHILQLSLQILQSEKYDQWVG